MAIECCNGCKPPKRNGYCHTYCPEYKEEQAQHVAEIKAQSKRNRTAYDINAQKVDGAIRAYKRQRKK